MKFTIDIKPYKIWKPLFFLFSSLILLVMSEEITAEGLALYLGCLGLFVSWCQLVVLFKTETIDHPMFREEEKNEQ